MPAWTACTDFLEHFVNLQVLHIMWPGDGDMRLDRLPRLLRLLPEPGRLRQLQFTSRFIHGRKPSMEDFDWVGDLDAELEHQHFHHLTKVECHVDVFLCNETWEGMCKSTFREQIVERIESKLQKLSSRRPPVLRINVAVG